jgi:hypothetical protein
MQWRNASSPVVTLCNRLPHDCQWDKFTTRQEHSDMNKTIAQIEEDFRVIYQRLTDYN